MQFSKHLITHRALWLFALALLAASQPAKAQNGLTEPVAKFVTPAFISGCNNDTIKIVVTNLYEPTSITCTDKNGIPSSSYPDPVKIKVNVPGGTVIQYVAGSVSSDPTGAASSSPTGNTVDITVPMPAQGYSTIVKFVVRADCGVLKLNPLPQFSATVAYPTPYPIVGETINSPVLSVGNAQLNVTNGILGFSNQNIAYGGNVFRCINIANGGYGNIDNITVTVESPDAFVETSTLTTPYGYPYSYGLLTAVSTTPLGNGITRRVYKVAGNSLGTDGLLTPGETMGFCQELTAPNACGIYDAKYKVEYQCAGGGAACDAPQYITNRTTVSAGTPKLDGKLVSVEYPDGCPKKKIVYEVTNTGAGGSTVVGNAYDVKLGISLGSGKATLSNVTLNGTPVTISGGLTDYYIDTQQFTSDPDGPGGLEDLDGDGKFDDMKPAATTTVSFFYTIPCDIACGADLNYKFSSSNTFTDFCRTLKGATSTSLANFGFSQEQPIEQLEKVDYGVLTAGESLKKTARFGFKYQQSNMNLSAATAELRISYSKKFEFDPSSVKLNGVPIAGVLQGTDTQPSTSTTDSTATASSSDSMFVYMLTAAQVTALFDSFRDSLSYDQTYYGCTDRQDTKTGDNWQLLIKTNPNQCPDGSTPCTFDLACKKAFAYASGNACGVKPCWITDFKLYRDKPVGSTDVTRTTPIPAIDSTRSYAGDTVAFNQNAFYTGKWFGEPIGQTVADGGFAKEGYDMRTYFNFNYSKPVGYKNGVSPWIFLENYSTVCVRKRIPNPTNSLALGTLGPVIFTAPLLASDFTQAIGIATVTTPTTPRGSSIAGPIPQAPYNGRTYNEYLCDTYNGSLWEFKNCPMSNYVESGNNWYQRHYNVADDKIEELYYIQFGGALARAGYTGPSNDDEYYYEVKTKWKMNPDFPWDNSNSYSFAGAVQHIGNNNTGVDYFSPASSYTTNCNDASATGTTVSKELTVGSPKQTYNAACGLRVSHKINFKSFVGNYFRGGEVRVPLTIDKIVAQLPSEYALAGTPNISLQYNQNCISNTSTTSVAASGSTGTVTFAGVGGGAFPSATNADGCSGGQTIYNLSYDLVKAGTAAPAAYTVPITIYGKDEFGGDQIFLDTIYITEADPILTITPVAASVQISDGTTPYGGVCTSFYTDYIIKNTAAFDAPNVYLAAKGNANVTILNINDLNPATPLAGSDTLRYGGVNMFGKLGTVKAGESRTIRVYATTTVCSDKVEVVADFGCTFPKDNLPDESSTNTNLVKASTAFTAENPTLQSKPVSDITISDLCATKTIEYEILNTGLPNLYKMLSNLTLPAGVSMVAGTAQLGYSTAGGFTGFYKIPTANISGSGTSQIGFDYSANSPFLKNDCGLPGADERPMNYVRLKFDVEFSACPAGGVAQLLLESTATNYCGATVTAKSAATLQFSSPTQVRNRYELARSTSPVKICNANAGVPFVMTDTIYVKNVGGFSNSGPTTGQDTVFFSFPNIYSYYSVTNISVVDAATFGLFPITLGSNGAQRLKIVIPAGTPVGGSVAVPITYTYTSKIPKLCQKSCPLFCIFGEYHTLLSLKCDAKGLDCSTVYTEYSKLTTRHAECCYGSIGDYVWTDTNQDGQQGSTTDEPPIAGVTVNLYQDTSGTGVFVLVATKLTDAMGHYVFDSLFTGNYQVQFIAPPGKAFTTPTTGAGSSDSNAGANGYSAVIPINTGLDPSDIGRNNPTIDAGILKCSTPITPALSVTNNTCSPNIAGGFSITTPCGAGTHIEYSLDGGTTWTGTPPFYNTTPLNVVARCVNDSDPTCFGANSVSVSTSPTICPPLPPGTPCSITITQQTQSVCNNNGTEYRLQDDFFTVLINASAINGGQRYEVVNLANTDGTGGNPLGFANYGTAVSVGGWGSLIANNTVFILTIRDLKDNNCFKTITLNPVPPCSTKVTSNNSPCGAVPCAPIKAVKNGQN